MLTQSFLCCGFQKVLLLRTSLLSFQLPTVSTISSPSREKINVANVLRPEEVIRNMGENSVHLADIVAFSK